MYGFEYVILVLFNSYVYHPGILKNPYFDNIMGSIFSNAIYIPSAAQFIAAFRLKLIWVVLITGIFLGIEWLFLALGIYKHFWWSTLYTAIGLPTFFLISRQWYILIRKTYNSFVQILTLYFISISILANFFFILAAFLKTHYFSIGWFENHTRDHVAFDAFYLSLLSIILVVLVYFRLNILFKSLGIILMLISNLILLKLNIMHVLNKWTLVDFAVVYVLGLVIILHLNRLLHKNNLLYP